MQRLVGVRKCPRCEAGEILKRLNDEGEEYEIGSLSRVTRDDGAEVLVCNRCGRREFLYGRDPANQVQLTDWPLDIDQLLEEERALLELDRQATFEIMSPEDLGGEAERD